MITEDLQNLYQTYLGEVPEEIVELPSSGSNRRYFRLTGTQKLIGVYGTSKEENEAFLYMAKTLPQERSSCSRSIHLF